VFRRVGVASETFEGASGSGPCGVVIRLGVECVFEVFESLLGFSESIEPDLADLAEQRAAFRRGEGKRTLDLGDLEDHVPTSKRRVGLPQESQGRSVLPFVAERRRQRFQRSVRIAQPLALNSRSKEMQPRAFPRVAGQGRIRQTVRVEVDQRGPIPAQEELLLTRLEGLGVSRRRVKALPRAVIG
jgi:hypothetical protein